MKFSHLIAKETNLDHAHREFGVNVYKQNLKIDLCFATWKFWQLENVLLSSANFLSDFSVTSNVSNERKRKFAGNQSDLSANLFKNCDRTRVGEGMNKTILHWSYHNLESIPLTLLDYKELEEVYLKENFIASIPEWLLKLINLRFIHLLGNLIREIPENIYFLENLEFLDLSNNRLCSLPASIGKLVNLKRFSVGGNEIRVLPKGKPEYVWFLLALFNSILS